MKQLREGYIYVIARRLTPTLVKIGLTIHHDIKKRHLDASNVPDDSELIYIKMVQNVDAVEKALHLICEPYRYNKEWFHACCVPIVKRLLDLLSIEDAGSATPPPVYHGVPRKKKP